MKLIGLLNIVFYAILLAAFFQADASFDLARHGLDFSWPTVSVTLAYYATLAVYLLAHKRRGRVLLDPYNMFLFLFSVLIVPGVTATGPIFSSYYPHMAMLFSGISFVAMGLLFEIASPGTTNRSFAVRYSPNMSRRTALTFLLIFLVLASITILTGNINRAGTFDVIFGLLSPSADANIGAIANYRTEIYHTWGLREVIGNYAGGVFGPFFALILFSYFFMQGRRTGNVALMVLAVAIAAFPVFFALGTGSRLQLLRTLLIYVVYASLPYGIWLLNRKVLVFGAFAFALLVMSTSILGRGVQGEAFSDNLVIQTEKSLARVFLGKGGSTMIVYEYYPHIESFEGGIPILERLLGINLDGKPSVAVKIFAYLTDGSLGTAGPQTFGDLFASFGYFGQFLFTLVLAISLLSLRLLYRRNPDKTMLDRALWAYLVVSVGYTGYSDLASFKAIGGVYVLVIYLILRFVVTGTRTARPRLPRSMAEQAVAGKMMPARTISTRSVRQP